MIIAIIPAFNEEKHIAKVLEGAENYVDKISVVNDGSTDNTEKIAKSFPKTEVITHKINRGKADAVVTGLKRALELNANVILLMDADSQHCPEDIPKLLEPIKNGECLFVSGYREHAKKPFLRAIAGVITDFLVGGKDILCGFKAIKADVFRNFDLSETKDYLIEVTLHDEAKRHGVKVKYVPIKTIYSPHIKSKVDYKREVLSFIRHRLNKLKKMFRK